MFELLLAVTTLLVGLVTGLLLGFAIVAMPGIAKLEHGEFIKSFQAMDRVIQDASPAFMALWVGSVLAVLGSLIAGFSQLEGADLSLLVGATIVYLAGVQLPTATINIPLNNSIQEVDVAEASAEALANARQAFEARWNRWNIVRSAFGTLATALMIVLLLRL